MTPGFAWALVGILLTGCVPAIPGQRAVCEETTAVYFDRIIVINGNGSGTLYLNGKTYNLKETEAR